MKIENVNTLIELTKEMQQNVARIINILQKSPKWRDLSMYEPDDFTIGRWSQFDDIYGETHETHCGETEYFDKYIPIEYLSLSDEELQQIVDKDLREEKERLEMLRKEKEQDELLIEKAELNQLKALAKKYGAELNFKDKKE